MSDISRSEEVADNETSKEWLSPRRFALLLAVFIIIPFFRVLAGGQTFIIRDFGLFSYPVAYYVKESFWRGEIPFWNPMSSCGVPFLAQFNTLTLYPPSIIYCLLPLTWALPFFCLLHVYIGGLGMYFLCRRWTGSNLGGAIAGVVFAFNGLSLSMLMWPSHTAGYALMPWVVYFAETAFKGGKRPILIAAIVAALQVLTGSPEEILFVWIFLFALGCVHVIEKQNTLPKTFSAMVAIGIVAAGLSAPAWLPFLDFTAHCNRSTQYADSTWSMPLFGWANFFVPLFQTQQWQTIVVQVGQYWTSSYYTGIATMFFVAIALLRRRELRVILLGAGLVLSLLLAFGDAGHLYQWLRKALPVVGMFRYPVKFVLLTTFIIPLLTAYAIASFETRVRWKSEWLIGAVLLGLICFIVYLAKVYSSEEIPWQRTFTNALWRGTFLIATIAAAFIFTRISKWRAISAGALLLLIWTDLLLHVPWQNPSADSSLYQPGLAQMKVQLKPEPRLGESRLLMAMDAMRKTFYRPAADPVQTLLLERVDFRGNLNFLDNVPKADSFFSLRLKESDRVINEIRSRSPAKQEHLEDLLGVSQINPPGKEFDWIPRTTYLPVVSTGQQSIFANDPDTFTAVLDPSTDIHKTVYLPIEAKTYVKAQREENARIIAKNVASNHLSITVETPNPAITLITQSYYHNWKAYVDGNPTKLWRADYGFQAVEMPAGKHELKLVYEDTAFKIGAGVFSATLLMCVAMWTYNSKRKPANGPTITESRSSSSATPAHFPTN